MTAIYRPRLRIRRSAKVAACFALAGSSVLLGCSDDSTDVGSSGSTTTRAGAATNSTNTNSKALYCETALTLSSDPGPDVDWATATPEDIAKGFAEWIPTMQAQVDRIEPIAPAELSDEIKVFRAALEAASEGDPSAFETPEVDVADKTIRSHDVAECGWPSINVTTRDYAFSGLPKTAEAGALNIEVTNEGPEVHEASILSVPGHVHGPLKQLISADQQTGARLRMVGSTGPIEPGSEGSVIVRLEPGRYVVTCYLPTGTTSMAALETASPDAVPHAMHGMAAEFTVE